MAAEVVVIEPPPVRTIVIPEPVVVTVTEVPDTVPAVIIHEGQPGPPGPHSPDVWIGPDQPVPMEGIEYGLWVETDEPDQTMNWLDKSGGTMTGPLVLADDATADMHPVTKRQWDATVTPPEVFVQPEDPGTGAAALWVDLDETAPVAPTWWAGTQTAYNAISVKDPSTLYIITGL